MENNRVLWRGGALVESDFPLSSRRRDLGLAVAPFPVDRASEGFI